MIRAPLERAPFPYDWTVNNLDVMLRDGPNGKVQTRKLSGLEQTIPNVQEYASKNILVERTVPFIRPFLGIGSRIQHKVDSKFAYYCDGVDTSVDGIAVLGPLFSNLTLPTNPGAVTQFIEYHGMLLASNANHSVYRKTANNDVQADWSISLYLNVDIIEHDATGGTFTVTYRGNTTAALAYSISAADLQIALRLLAGLGACVVTRDLIVGLYIYAITMYSAFDDAITMDGSLLTGTTIGFTAGGAYLQTPRQMAYQARSPIGGGTSVDQIVVGMTNGPAWWFNGGSWTQGVGNWGAVCSYQDRAYAAHNSTNNVYEQIGAPAEAVPNLNHVRPIGSATYHANWMLVDSDVAYVWKQDGLYVFNIDTTYETSVSIGAGLIREIKHESFAPDDATNGVGAIVWNGNIWAPFVDCLAQVTGGPPHVTLFDRKGPERLMENLSPVKGKVTCLAGWSNYFLFIGVWDGVTTRLCKVGSWVHPEDGNGLTWEYITDPINGSLMKWTKQATAMIVSTIGDPNGNPRLYVGFADGTIEWCVLPKNSPFAPDDANCRYQSTGSVYYPLHDGGFQEFTKLYRGVSGFGTSIAVSAQNIALYYGLDGDVPLTPIGPIDANGQRQGLPAGITGHYISLKATLATNDSTKTPLWDGLAIHEALIPPAIAEHSLSVRATDGFIRRDGNVEPVITADAIRNTIRSAAAAATDVPATMPDGTAQRLLIKDWSEHQVTDERGNAIDYVIDVVAIQLGLIT